MVRIGDLFLHCCFVFPLHLHHSQIITSGGMLYCLMNGDVNFMSPHYILASFSLCKVIIFSSVIGTLRLNFLFFMKLSPQFQQSLWILTPKHFYYNVSQMLHFLASSFYLWSSADRLSIFFCVYFSISCIFVLWIIYSITIILMQSCPTLGQWQQLQLVPESF